MVIVEAKYENELELVDAAHHQLSYTAPYKSALAKSEKGSSWPFEFPTPTSPVHKCNKVKNESKEEGARLVHRPVAFQGSMRLTQPSAQVVSQ